MKRATVVLIVAAILFAAIGVVTFAQSNSNLEKMVISAARSGTTVNLSWPAVAGAVKYEVYAYHESTEWVKLGGDSLTATNTTHTNATPGNRYYYTGRAVASDGSISDWADYASVTIPSDATAGPTVTPTLTATPDPAGTATPTPTATPEAAATPDTSNYCTLIEYAPSDQPWPDISVPLIGNETLANYRSTFGENLDDLSILQVDLLADGYIRIVYYESFKRRLGAEFYRGCDTSVYYYSQWQQLEPFWWRAYEEKIESTHRKVYFVEK